MQFYSLLLLLQRTPFNIMVISNEIEKQQKMVYSFNRNSYVAYNKQPYNEY